MLTDDEKQFLRLLTAHFDDVNSMPAQTGISEATAAYIDQLMQGYWEHRGILVDRNRLTESHEAWVYIDIQFIDDPTPQFVNFGAAKGVLTWENSN